MGDEEQVGDKTVAFSEMWAKSSLLVSRKIQGAFWETWLHQSASGVLKRQRIEQDYQAYE